MRSRVLAACAAVTLLGGCAATRFSPPPTGLHAETFGVTKRSAVKTLVVVLHGDGTPDRRADQYAFAKAASDAVPDSAAIAILRPGYADAKGNRSSGIRGNGTGDNYTEDRLRSIADSIAAAKAQLPHARTILVGGGGGAAIAADLAGIRPELVDAMLLVSCPCTLPEWRHYMDDRTPAKGWARPDDSLDPLKTAGGVDSHLRAVILVGDHDEAAPGKYSRPYAEALALRGIATDYRIVPGDAPLRLDNPEVLNAVKQLAASLPEKR